MDTLLEELVEAFAQPKTCGRRVKNKKSAPTEDAVKKLPSSYLYDAKNKDLPLYGVIVTWDQPKCSNKTLQNMLQENLELIRSIPKEEAQNKKSQLKRKPMPFIRRVGPQKAIVMFRTMEEANCFSKVSSADFYAFIPLSFVVTIGVAIFNTFHVDIKEIQTPTFEILQWRKKKVTGNKLQLTIAVRGTKLPESLNYKGDQISLVPYQRQPVYCIRCLRYGHRIHDCMRKPRCGFCIRNKPAASHRENKCNKKRNGKGRRCIFCDKDHTIGAQECIEHTEQLTYKMQLVKHHMDFVSALESEIIPTIRTTLVNSSRDWLGDAE